ncbi:MAG TPA: LysR substrate-binding domain-containing protein [Actinocrinis sp.]|nr:LysR substrate-binding domain-containing protein [Actinocrinis sp.]
MDLRTLNYFVAVAEELHFGRAAARLHISQPPLSRAVKQLETDFGCELLIRSPSGVSLTAAGSSLYEEARGLLAQADRLRARVTAAAGGGGDSLSIGTLGDSAEPAGTRLAAAFRHHHPGVRVHIREADLTDPTVGLRTGLVDVALTRLPFDDAGISVHVLRSDPVGVVLRTGDPLAHRAGLRLSDLADRRWFRLPDDTEPVWRAFWNGPSDAGTRRDGPIVRTAHECIQSVLWNGTVGLAPLGHALPDGLITVPLTDMPPSRLVVAWARAHPTPLIRSFARIASAIYGPAVTAV